MFHDARTIPLGKTLRTDICIVGSGHAGIALAQEFDGSLLDVIVLESGGFRREKMTQDLYRGDSLGPHHARLDMYRERTFGGTSTVWGGRCSPYDSIDMETRPYIPFSGWPIRREDLDQAYQRAYELCDIGRYSVLTSELIPHAQPEMVPGLKSDRVKTDRAWLFSLPTNFGRKFRRTLSESANVHTYLHANCTKIQVSPEGTAVDHLQATSLRMNSFKVQARYYVLCMGGLEVTRTLLISDDVHEGGIGNTYGHLGRYYISHMNGKVGPINLTPKGPLIWNYENTVDGIYCRRAFRIDEAVQHQLGLPNFRGTLDVPPTANPHHRSSVLSAMYLLRRFTVRHIPPEYAAELAGLGPYKNVPSHLKNLLSDFPSLLRFAGFWFSKRLLARRKIPSVLFQHDPSRYFLHYDAEQIPNAESRIYLSQERDALGARKLVVDYKFEDRDVEGVVRALRVFAEEISRTNTGRLEMDEPTLAERVRKYQGVGSHNYGTTRMAAHRREGVVDSDCQVFAVGNLFISSSSVFPTSSFANPALTICAFAVRLADHLKLISKKSPSVRMSGHGTRTNR